MSVTKIRSYEFEKTLVFSDEVAHKRTLKGRAFELFYNKGSLFKYFKDNPIIQSLSKAGLITITAPLSEKDSKEPFKVLTVNPEDTYATGTITNVSIREASFKFKAYSKKNYKMLRDKILTLDGVVCDSSGIVSARLSFREPND